MGSLLGGFANTADVDSSLECNLGLSCPGPSADLATTLSGFADSLDSTDLGTFLGGFVAAQDQCRATGSLGANYDIPIGRGYSSICRASYSGYTSGLSGRRVSCESGHGRTGLTPDELEPCVGGIRLRIGPQCVRAKRWQGSYPTLGTDATAMLISGLFDSQQLPGLRALLVPLCKAPSAQAMETMWSVA